jgi:hypothetical protein
MALPQGFSEFEFLQDMMRKWQNRIVREEFNSLGGEDWEPDISISEGALRHACTHKDTDTAEMMQMRNDLFYIIYGKAKKLQGTIYGIPEETFKEDNEIKPQIGLYFAQDSDAAPDDRTVITAEYYINLQRDIPEASWETELKQLARKIQQEFAPSHPTYTWTKGKTIYWYRDKEYGHNFQIYANTEAEAEPLIKKMLAIQDQIFKEDCLVESTPKRKSVNNPAGTVLKFGKRRKKPRWRPVANVRFRWANLIVPELNGDRMLVDTTGFHYDALLRA